MKVDNLKCMSIGNHCAGLLFLGDCRVVGPVDNLNVKNDKIGFELLFNGKFLEQFNAKPIITNRVPQYEEDSDKIYSYSHHQVVHNSPFEEKWKVELQKRYNTFLDFYSHIQEPNYYFILTLNSEVNRCTHKMRNVNLLQREINLLKNLNILNKTIFVSTRNDTDNFKSWWNFWADDLDKYLKGCFHIQIEGLVGHTKITNEQFLKKFNELESGLK